MLRQWFMLLLIVTGFTALLLVGGCATSGHAGVDESQRPTGAPGDPQWPERALIWTGNYANLP